MAVELTEHVRKRWRYKKGESNQRHVGNMGFGKHVVKEDVPNLGSEGLHLCGGIVPVFFYI